MKKLFSSAILTVTFISTSTLATNNGGLFDIAHDEFVAGKVCVEGSNSVDITVATVGLVQAYITDMEAYSRELDEQAEAMEWFDMWQNALVLNEDRTDGVAYAAIRGSMGSGFNFEDDTGRSRWLSNGDLISGSDWDNDGYIDILKDVPRISYNNASIQVRD